MKSKKFMVMILLVILSFPAKIFADRSNIGTSGAAFLKIGAGARPAALGEAFGSLVGDVNNIFYNPAGLAGLTGVEFMAQYGLWFQSIGYNVLGLGYPVEKIGTFGVGIINLNINNIDRRTADTLAADGTFAAGDFAYILSYSRQISKRIAGGLNVKWISQKIDTDLAQGLGADAGILWQPLTSPLTLGLAVQNLGNEIKFNEVSDPLPLNYKFGFGYKIFNDKIVLGLDFNLARDNDLRTCIGAEYNLSLKNEIGISIRSGYRTIASEQLGGLSGLSAGLGIIWRYFGFDFAWVPYGELGDTFRYCLRGKF